MTTTNNTSTVEIENTATTRRGLLRRKLESIIELYAMSLCRQLIRPEFEAPLDAELSRVATLLGIGSFIEMKAAKLAACRQDSSDIDPEIEESDNSADLTIDTADKVDTVEIESQPDQTSTELTSADNSPVAHRPAERLTDTEWTAKYEQFFYQKYCLVELPRVDAEIDKLDSEIIAAKKTGVSKERLDEMNAQLKEAKAVKRRLEQKSTSAQVLESSRELAVLAFDRQSGTPSPEMISWRIAKLERESFDVVKNLDYFPTPPDVAGMLSDASYIWPGMTILEPSAGKGNLADVCDEPALHARRGMGAHSSCLLQLP